MSLMISISGIRGIVGETLTPELVARYAAAFGVYCRRHRHDAPTVVIGRDGRISGHILAEAVASGLQATGMHVHDLGICPTPTVQIAVEHEGAGGGISITASHNPIQWNGLKFIGASDLPWITERYQSLKKFIRIILLLAMLALAVKLILFTKS